MGLRPGTRVRGGKRLAPVGTRAQEGAEGVVKSSKHSIATHLLDAGADLRFVQDWIGHASIRNTVIYAQFTSRRRDEEARKVFASSYVV